MALASSMRVDQRLRLSNSTCMRLQKDSMTALSKQSPTEPIDGSNPESIARRVKAREVGGFNRSTQRLDEEVSRWDGHLGGQLPEPAGLQCDRLAVRRWRDVSIGSGSGKP